VALRRSRRTSDRRGAPSDFLIVGLANPGTEYEASRHNVGGDAVRRLAQAHGAQLKVESRQRCATATITTPIGRVTLAVPTTYMNESGAAMNPLLERVSLAGMDRVLIAHDELDLEPGRLQLKVGGGLAGHNGLKSIAGSTGTQDFLRLRIGVGKPPTKEQGASWVLSKMTGTRRAAYEQMVADASDALDIFLNETSVEAAQRRINAMSRD